MIDDCWNTIGVRGDATCPELKLKAHCRNCGIYARAAVELLRAAPAPTPRADSSSHSTAIKVDVQTGSESVLIFRIDAEWLALPTAVVDEVAAPSRVHSLPHARSAAVLGLANVRGELLISVSLRHLLDIPSSADDGPSNGQSAKSRLLVLRRETLRVVCPVNEVSGICHFRPEVLREIPATLARASGRYSTKLLPWNGRSVGVLDDQLLFYTVKRNVA